MVEPSPLLEGASSYAAESSRIYLEVLSVEKHLADYHTLWSDRANLVTIGYEPTKTTEESRTRMVPYTASPERSWVENYAILLKPTTSTTTTTSAETPSQPKFIGQLGITRIIHKAPPSLSIESNAPTTTTSSTTQTSPEAQFVGLVGVVRTISKAPASLSTEAGTTTTDNTTTAAGKSTLVNGAPELGYMICATHQGKGLGTEAVRTFLKLYWSLERRKDVDFVVAVVDSWNTGSWKVMEKVGGRKVGKEEKGKGEFWVLERGVAVGDGIVA